MNTEYDIEQAAQAQTDYCDAHKLPIFAPRDGECSFCGRNIYQLYIHHGKTDREFGISVKEAGSRLITSCPHCSHTFID